MDVEALLTEASANLGSPADEDALSALRAAHVGRTFADAFRSTLDWLLGASVPIVDAADASEKPALVPLAVRLVRERRDVHALLRARDEALEKAASTLSR